MFQTRNYFARFEITMAALDGTGENPTNQAACWRCLRQINLQDLMQLHSAPVFKDL